MEKIDITKIRGEWVERGEIGSKYEHIANMGGNDTVESIKMVAERVNEIMEWINSKDN